MQYKTLFCVAKAHVATPGIEFAEGPTWSAERPYAIYPSLAGLAVFVTGGGSEIEERALVEHFCAQGANVSFVDIAEEPSRALVEIISARGYPAPVSIPVTFPMLTP